MKKTKFNETKILGIIKEAEAGMSVAEISRKYGISNGTFYNWKNKYAGMNGSEIRRMRQLEDENGTHWAVKARQSMPAVFPLVPLSSRVKGQKEKNC